MKNTLPEKYHERDVFSYVYVFAPKERKNKSEGMFLVIPKAVAFGGKALGARANGSEIVLWGDRSLQAVDLISIKYKSVWEHRIVKDYCEANKIVLPEKKGSHPKFAIEGMFRTRKVYEILSVSEEDVNMVAIISGINVRNVYNIEDFFRENKTIGLWLG